MSGGDIHVTLDCGCAVTVTQGYDYGCAGDCHPGSYYPDGGRIDSACEQHSPDTGGLGLTIADLKDKLEEANSERDSLRSTVDYLEGRVGRDSW